MVISNTTPLINFAETNLLEILEQLFPSVIIPEAVAEELRVKASLFPKAAKVPELSFVEITNPVSEMLTAEFERGLHPGEAACLALASESNSHKLLLDDVAARQVARFHHLEFTGTLGCLLEAKRRKLLPKIEPLLEDLANLARFWIHPDLKIKMLQIAGESTEEA